MFVRQIRIFLFVFFFSISVAFAEEGVLKMTFVGDILLAGQAGRIIQETDRIEYPFEKVVSVLSRADITFGNLECALTGNIVTRNVRQGPNKWFCFKTPPKMGKALVYGGFDIVTLANNHSMNGGERGLKDTIETLNELAIEYIGAGQNYEEAHELKITEAKGFKIGFLGYSDLGYASATKTKPGIAKVSLDILNEITEAKNRVDILIISLHWGIEGSTEPTERQRKLAQQIIDAGADLIIGHHPHVLQPIEKYKGKLIAYSLGNFVFDNPRLICCKTIILWVEIDKDKKISYKKIPCRIKNAQPVLVEQN